MAATRKTNRQTGSENETTKPKKAPGKPKAAPKSKAAPAKAKSAAVKPKATTAKKTAPTRRTQASSAATLGAEERRQLIEQMAYLKAEADGFSGDPVQYWLAAEAEVMAKAPRRK